MFYLPTQNASSLIAAALYGLFKPHSKHLKLCLAQLPSEVWLWFPYFNSWYKWGPGKCSSLPKITGVGSGRAGMQTQCRALKTCVTMQSEVRDSNRTEGAVLRPWDFLWVPGLAGIVSPALSDKSWSWSLYALVYLAYLSSLSFWLRAQDTHG